MEHLITYMEQLCISH